MLRRSRGSAPLRQWYADLLASFWLRPSAMAVVAVLFAQLLIWSEGSLPVPAPLDRWVYAGGVEGARSLLGVVAGASIGVAGTTFSITVAALTLASNQMGPSLLRNFTRDAGNQYALGTFLATFAYSLTVLRTVRGLDDDDVFVPQLAVSVGLLLAFACVGVLMWFLHHVATSINVSQVVALVSRDLGGVIDRLPRRDGPREAAMPAEADPGGSAPLIAPRAGYLRALDDEALADWAAEAGCVLGLRVRPGDFVFPDSVIGEVAPAARRDGAQEAIGAAMTLGESRSIEDDPEYAVRQLVEIALRALSPSLNDPFTAIGVLDRFGAALCRIAVHDLPDGSTAREGVVRLRRRATDYKGLVDAMFHMIRQTGAGDAATMIRLVEVLAEVCAVERDPLRRDVLRRHGGLIDAAASDRIGDAAGRAALAERMARLRAALAIQ